MPSDQWLVIPEPEGTSDERTQADEDSSARKSLDSALLSGFVFSFSEVWNNSTDRLGGFVYVIDRSPERSERCQLLGGFVYVIFLLRHAGSHKRDWRPRWAPE